MSQYVYVLCSKYSPKCTEFIKTVKQYNIDIIYPIYVDDKMSRNIIINSPLNIKTLPCILGNVNGYIATYEGKDAFDLLHEIKNQYITPSKPLDEEDNNIYDVDSENLNAHVNHKIKNPKSIIEQMMKDREIDDELLHDKRRVVNVE